MRPQLLIPIFAAALALGACGGYDSGSSSGAPGDAEQAAAAAGQGTGEALVRTGQTALGEVLTTADGRTLYGLTDDAQGVPTCDGACAEVWPPLLVDGPELPAGLDPAVFGVAERLDGTHQLTAGGSPLYTYAEDEAPGDVNGQGSGGVWFAARPDGQLIVGSSTTSVPPATTPATTGPAAGGQYEYGSDDGYGY